MYSKKEGRKTKEYQSVRRIRKAREKCGCKTLRLFLLFARQIGRVPKEFDVDDELKKLRHRNTASDSIVTFAEEVHERPGNFFKNLWEATQSSGRTMA
jgi:hypothetical protein